MHPKSVAIRSAYFHHAANAGYKQILTYTKPEAVFGIDERNLAQTPSIFRKYLFLNEFRAAAYIRKNPVQILHILYGEEYFRFSASIVNCPVIVTFHQPADILTQEITRGNYMGKVSAIANRLNRNRFQKMAAAIVMTEAQKDVLSQVCDPKKIYCVPLGADLKTLSLKAKSLSAKPLHGQILTVGEWQRDWDFYCKFVEHCATHKPEWRFVLVNRKLNPVYKNKLKKFSTVDIPEDVDDEVLYNLYKSSELQFLPFLGAAGNNSVNESLALGCPIATNTLGSTYRNSEKIISQFNSQNLDSAVRACEKFIGNSAEQRMAIEALAQDSVSDYDWEKIGEKTLEIYKSVL